MTSRPRRKKTTFMSVALIISRKQSKDICNDVGSLIAAQGGIALLHELMYQFSTPNHECMTRGYSIIVYCEIFCCRSSTQDDINNSTTTQFVHSILTSTFIFLPKTLNALTRSTQFCLMCCGMQITIVMALQQPSGTRDLLSVEFATLPLSRVMC